MTDLNKLPKILIVDDTPNNLYVLDKILRQLEVQVIPATRGTGALALTQEHEFCMAIVDVQMPEMDGYELVELLRSNPSTASLPVIFVSAIYSDEYHHRKGYDTGAVDFMSKPFNSEILLGKVRVFLDLYRQRVQLQELVEELNTKNDALVQVTGELQEANLALSKRAVQLEASNQVGQQVTSILELDILLTAVVESIQTRFGYYFVGVWLLNQSQDHISLYAGLGRAGSRPLQTGYSINLETTPSVVTQVARSGQAYRAEDITVDPNYLDLKPLPHTRSKVALPLRVGQEIIGVLDIHSDHQANFDDDDQQVLQTLANQIAVAIRNARLYELEKQLNANKDKFFSIISHDLRGPFSNLLTGTELLSLMIEQTSPEEVKKFAEDLHHQTQVTYQLLENLLTWSRLQRGRMDFKPTSVELTPLVNKTVSLLETLAADKQIWLKQNINEPLVLQADVDMIDTVIRNLTSNAIKFTPRGGQVTISARKNGHSANHNGTDWVEISISDTGVGISPENIKKLFRIEFHHTTLGTNEEVGTGLGLLLCKEMVKKNGGQIWIESELGQSTTVKFTVPAGDQSVNR